MLARFVRRSSVVLFAITILAPAALSAQDAEAEDVTAEARALFEEGLELADAGDWERAVHRFRRALDLREATPVRYNLAMSLAHMGRMVEALAELERVLADPSIGDDVRAPATALRDALRSRLGGLVVEVVGDHEGTVVTVDGRPWEALGFAAPADPGIRVVRLLRGTTQLDVAEADVPTGDVARVTLEVPREVPAGALEGDAPPAEAGGSDDGWIWGVVIGLVVVAAAAATVTAVVLMDQGPSTTMGDFMPPMLEIRP